MFVSICNDNCLDVKQTIARLIYFILLVKCDKMVTNSYCYVLIRKTLTYII